MTSHPADSTERRGLRRLAPRGGLAYELFDVALMVLGVSLLWYVTTEPSVTTEDALSDTIALLLSPQAWGIVMSIAAAAAAVMAYGPTRAVRAGYVVLGAVCVSWAVSLTIGVCVTLPPWEIAGKALGTALVYAWATRRVVREVLRESAAQG